MEGMLSRFFYIIIIIIFNQDQGNSILRTFYCNKQSLINLRILGGIKWLTIGLMIYLSCTLEESSPDVSYLPDAPEEISSKYHKECVHLLAGCLLH